jgi:hypothetical protein
MLTFENEELDTKWKASDDLIGTIKLPRGNML